MVVLLKPFEKKTFSAASIISLVLCFLLEKTEI